MLSLQLDVSMKMVLLLDNMEAYKGNRKSNSKWWYFNKMPLRLLRCHTPSIIIEAKIAMQDPLITICSIQNLLQVALTSKLKLNFDLKVDDSTTKIVSVIYSFLKERKYSVVEHQSSGITTLWLSFQHNFSSSTHVVVIVIPKK